MGRTIKGKRYHYYHCENHRDVCSNSKYYPALETEKLAISFLRDFYSEDSRFKDMVIQNLERGLKKMSRGNPEESMRNHLKRINQLDAEIERAQDLCVKGLLPEDKLKVTLERNTQEKKAHQAEVSKLSDLEAYRQKIQTLNDTWHPILEGMYADYLGFEADEGNILQVGEDEVEYEPPTDVWLQAGAEFRREKYLELGIKVICTPQEQWIEVEGDKIFVGTETSSTARDASNRASRASSCDSLPAL